MMSMYQWLACLADKLEQAGINKADIAIAISESQDRKLREEVQANSNVWVQTAHHSEYQGWRIIVKGK